MRQDESDSSAATNAYNGADGVPLYVRVAMSLRTEIFRSVWKEGQLLPTFEDLALQYGVGLNTVRKAIQVLSSEKLVTTARGMGTRVVGTLPRKPHEHIRTTINDPLQISPDVRIKIITNQEVDLLPPELREDHRHAPRYRNLYKSHSFRSVPFALLDIYVDKDVYDRFPKGKERRHKLSWLMSEHGNVEIDSSREELTVGHADQHVAAILNCPIAASLARLRRWHFDREGRVLYACIAVYRGDLFVWDVKHVATGREHLSGQIIPAIRTAQ